MKTQIRAIPSTEETGCPTENVSGSKTEVA